MTNSQSLVSRSFLLAWMMTLAVIVSSGCNLLSLPDSPDVPPDDGGGEVDPSNPDPDVKPNPGPTRPEAEYWSELAAQVAAGELTNTDQIVLTAQRLKSRGVLSDLSRLAALEATRLELTDANRATIADQIRGK